MNFTGHTKLTDEEFKKWYPRLFEKCPRPSTQRTKEYKEEVEIKRTNFFKFQKLTKDISVLPWEIWKPYPKDETWEISNLARVRINGIIQEQIDNPNGSKGYLVLKDYTKTLIYRLVADVFLDRKEGEYLEVHHIDNNGYNCSEDNLIMLTKTQHTAINKNEMEEL